MNVLLLFCRTCLLPSLRNHSPLRDRVERSSHCKSRKESSTCCSSSLRPSKYRTWSDLSMREALDAISQQRMSVSKAAEMYGIPRTTLNDHKLGKVLAGSKPGPPALLTTSEEEDLVKFLIHSAEIGFGRTRKEVLDIVSRMLSRKGTDKVVTNGWWNKFICRNPILTTRVPATLSISRAKASTRECIDAYFDTLEKILHETGLTEYPGLLFNMDETGFALDPKSKKIFVGKKTPSQFLVAQKDKTLSLFV